MHNTPDEYITRLEKLNKEFRVKFEAFNLVLAKEIFDQCPNISAIRASGYTPYFNDGDPCYHYMQEPEFCLDIDANYDFDYIDTEETLHAGDWARYDDVGEFVNKHIEAQVQKFKELSEPLCSEGYSKLYENIIGTNNYLCITREGDYYVQENYDHE